MNNRQLVLLGLSDNELWTDYRMDDNDYVSKLRLFKTIYSNFYTCQLQELEQIVNSGKEILLSNPIKLYDTNKYFFEAVYKVAKDPSKIIPIHSYEELEFSYAKDSMVNIPSKEYFTKLIGVKDILINKYIEFAKPFIYATYKIWDVDNKVNMLAGLSRLNLKNISIVRIKFKQYASLINHGDLSSLLEIKDRFNCIKAVVPTDISSFIFNFAVHHSNGALFPVNYERTDVVIKNYEPQYNSLFLVDKQYDIEYAKEILSYTGLLYITDKLEI